jgi:hypothetical protein
MNAAGIITLFGAHGVILTADAKRINCQTGCQADVSIQRCDP